ncbi:MAG: serine hydrolase domain-containing protein [Candidatus Nanopelagicales bacterium]
MTVRGDSSSLQAWLTDAARGWPGAIAAGTADRGVRATAVIGCTAGDDFEIGSVAKAITGLLYADSVTAGVLEPGTRLGELVDVGTGPVAEIAVSDLAVHRSGLPRLPAGINAARRTWDLWRHGANPYGDSLADLLVQASATGVGRRRFRYSNLGFELLGHAIASAHGTRFADLLRTRVTGPLGMERTYAPYEAQDLGPRALPGHSRRGRARDPWTGEAVAPAGGIRATIMDMTTLARALLDGTAPGVGALDPVERVAGPARIGAAWMTVPRNGRTLTWHNGRTGGFSAWIGLDRARGSGAVVLSATSRSVDRLGEALLDRIAAP